MTVTPSSIPDVLIIEPRIFADSRGYFFESFNQAAVEEAVGPVRFVQDNESRSTYGVVRGLHFQKPPYTQAKLVRCVEGRVLDVAVDLRAGSPTYLQHVAVELTGDNHLQLYIPKGFAHGFSVLSPTALFQYKCDELYNPASDSGIQLLDPSLGIDWQIPEPDMVLSAKDIARLPISETGTPFTY